MDNVYRLEKNDAIKNLFFTHLISKDDFGRHAHDFYEIVYITEGTAKHELHKTKQILETGDVVIIPPSVYHCWERKTDSFFSHRDIIVSSDLFQEICQFLSPNFINDATNNGKSLFPKFSLSKSALEYFENIFSNFSFENGRLGQNSPAFLSMAKSTIAALLSSLIKISKNDKYPQWLETLLEQMHNPDALKLGLTEILQSVPYNHIYLCRVFKKYLGKTMTDYFNDIRLDYAKLYLISTSKTITGISDELGFSSYTYFYKIFKNKFGLLPKQYRKKHLSTPPPKK